MLMTSVHETALEVWWVIHLLRVSTLLLMLTENSSNSLLHVHSMWMPHVLDGSLENIYCGNVFLGDLDNPVLTIYYPGRQTGSRRFDRVKPPQTHDKLSYDRNFLWSSAVQEGSVPLKNSQLMSISATGQVPSPVLWFEQVRVCSIGFNH
jgi:hypothetical protein